MICIYCAGPLEVTNSRAQASRNQVWRRRKCQKCGAIYTTHEAIDLSAVLAVQIGSKPTPFERDKLFLSIYNACRHRSTAPKDARHLLETSLKKILETAKDGTITPLQIIQLVSQILRRFDSAAAVQYNAFHKHK